MVRSRVCHVAIADDWEMSVNIGSYEAATRGVLHGPGQPIRVVPAERVRAVLDERYRDLTLPLLLIVLDTGGLTAAGIPVEQDGERGALGIGAPLPPADETIVRAVLPVHREGDRWIAPDQQTVEDA